MVVDIIVQTEINKKEYKLYPVRPRPFYPNLNVRPLAGKFYARHDYPDPSLYDEATEKAIEKRQAARCVDRYSEPATTNMEYGWYTQIYGTSSLRKFFYPKRSSWITQIGAVIAMEDQKNPKKPFTGIAFKL